MTSEDWHLSKEDLIMIIDQAWAAERGDYED